MEGPPPRFRCPPEFEAVSGGVPMGGPQAELWLIRAPMDFCPQSLEGCPVPLNGLERLRPGDNDNDNDDSATTGATYVLRGGPAAAGWHCPLLLSPMSPGGVPGLRPRPEGDPEHHPQLRDTEGGTWGHRGDSDTLGGDSDTLGDSATLGGDSDTLGGDSDTLGDSDRGAGTPRGDEEEEEEEEGEEGRAGVTPAWHLRCHLCHLCHR
ncbi:uncharacterized protein LOC131570477 [Ammospiza caudacuta]|uniref:uncharacterized protein LOC131570477 n=1 Tax=Ammospiza caudacuta TaxID=2857398 RepID=UPI0027382DEF|nr:uncharacterized protein LOC131570477 [Ammospiza caudacuta]